MEYWASFSDAVKWSCTLDKTHVSKRFSLRFSSLSLSLARSVHYVYVFGKLQYCVLCMHWIDRRQRVFHASSNWHEQPILPLYLKFVFRYKLVVRDDAWLANCIVIASCYVQRISNFAVHFSVHFRLCVCVCMWMFNILLFDAIR